MANLYFFTMWYPFKEGAEAFIENELPIASEYFDKIFIAPMTAEGSQRAIPSNAYVLQPPFSKKRDIIVSGLKGLNHNTIVRLVNDVIKTKSWRSLTAFKSHIIQYLIFSGLRNSKTLRDILNHLKKDDILYSYWGNGWGTVITSFNDLQNKRICRFHRFDLYVDRSNKQLFRDCTLQNLDLGVFISQHGLEYEQKSYPSIPFNAIVSHLGTLNHGIARKSSDGKLRIVSCSRLSSIKRVDLIFKALLDLNNTEIEWTHLGGGDLFDELKQLVDTTPHNFSVNLVGNLSNQDVLNYYSTHPVDLFINVSSSEGLPVSIMEAISFDIPIIATNVGGTSEIVNEETGKLISGNPSTNEICEAIKEVMDRRYSARKYWEKYFDARRNYITFYNLLRDL